jgi:glutamate-ammonia-ligase adenylyltransferase
VNGFEKYQKNNAWVWEHQALVRARPVAGDKGLAELAEKIRRQVLVQKRDPGQLQKEVLDMREKMRISLDKSSPEKFDLKQGKGGITDIEFMVKYDFLRWARDVPALVAWTDNIRLLEAMAEAELIPAFLGESLVLAYQRFRDQYHHLALQEQGGLVDDELLMQERQWVQQAWQQILKSGD